MHPAVVAVERRVLLAQRPDGDRRGPRSRRRPPRGGGGGPPVREATPNEVKSAIAGYGAADKEQVQRMVQLVLGMATLPTPDDAADALAIAVCIAGSLGQVGRTNGATAAVLDRSASAPISRGGSPYERAVREALARDKRAPKAAPS